MELKFNGHSCFSLKTNQGIQIITDPHSKLSSLEARIVTVSHNTTNHNQTSKVGGSPQILDWPGEYEIEGIAITGIDASNQERGESNIIFKFILDQVRVCHLGDFSGKLTDKMLDKIGNIDILIVPVGGKNSLNAEQAKKIIEDIDPRIIIPMHYQGEEIDAELDSVDKFLREMGKSNIEPQDSFSATRSSLPSDDSEIVVLKSSF